MRKTVLANCTILDGQYPMAPMGNLSIVIDGERIEAITGEALSPDDVNYFDMLGHYVLPGLVNLSACLPAKGRPGAAGGRGASTS